MTAAQFWEERYAARPVWSGKVNATMAQLVAGLPSGRALDLGCGEGGDALWLAEQGWQVTAVDVSAIAIERGRTVAAERGLTERIEWITTDLTDWSPSGSFDLVTASFLQSPLPLQRSEILRTAAAALAPGGRLLVLSHAAAPPWASGLQHAHAEFPQPASELALLGLPAVGWTVLVAEVRRRPATGPDGSAAELDDTVVFVRRD